jgi:hypothetical protein
MTKRFRLYLAHKLSELAIWVLPHGETIPHESDRYELGPVYPEGWGPEDNPCGYVAGE